MFENEKMFKMKNVCSSGNRKRIVILQIRTRIRQQFDQIRKEFDSNRSGEILRHSFVIHLHYSFDESKFDFIGASPRGTRENGANQTATSI